MALEQPNKWWRSHKGNEKKTIENSWLLNLFKLTYVKSIIINYWRQSVCLKGWFWWLRWEETIPWYLKVLKDQ